MVGHMSFIWVHMYVYLDWQMHIIYIQNMFNVPNSMNYVRV